MVKKVSNKTGFKEDATLLNRRLEQVDQKLTVADLTDVTDIPGSFRKFTNFSNDRDLTCRFMLATMNEGALILSPDGKIAYCNRSFAELIQSSADQLFGAIFIQYIHREERARFGELLRQAKNTRCRGEFNLHTTVENTIIVYLSINIITFGSELHYLIFAADVTECRRAEEALRKSEEQFRTMFETSLSMMILLEPESGKIYRANAAACSIFGLTPREIAGKKITELSSLSQEDVFPDIQTQDHNLKKYFTFKHRQPTGEIGFFEAYGNSFTLGNQNLYFSIIHNVTDRKYMEAVVDQLLIELGDRVKELDTLYALTALSDKPDAQLEEVVQQVIDFLPVAWLEHNEFCARLQLNSIHYSTGNFKKTDYLKEFPIYSGNQRIGNLELYYLGKNYDFWANRSFEGERNLLQVIIRRLGQIVGRLQAEKALQKREERYRAVVENQGEGTCYADGNENIEFANPAAEKIFGVGPGELLGRNLGEFMLEEQFVLVIQQTSSRRRGEKSSYEVEITRLDGEKRNLLITANPVFDDQGTYNGAFGIFRDITGRKQVEGYFKRGDV